jgi:hypothetical protein
MALSHQCDRQVALQHWWHAPPVAPFDYIERELFNT